MKLSIQGVVAGFGAGAPTPARSAAAVAASGGRSFFAGTLWGVAGEV